LLLLICFVHFYKELEPFLFLKHLSLIVGNILKDLNHIKKQLAKGDTRVLKSLWLLHSTSVLNLAYRVLLDRDAAEDILMDIFVALPESLQNFRGHSSLSTWLYKLTLNACLMQKRQHKRRIELEIEQQELIQENIFSTPSTPSTPEAPSAALEKALNTLSPEMRSLIWLKEVEGLEIKDLASLFDIPEGTVKSRLSRSKQKLQQILTPSYSKEFAHV